MWYKGHHLCLVIGGDACPLKNGLFLVIVKYWEMVCGKNGIAKDQLGELGILEKERSCLTSCLGGLRWVNVSRVEEGSSQALLAWWKRSSISCLLWFHVLFPKLLSLPSLSITSTPPLSFLFTEQLLCARCCWVPEILMFRVHLLEGKKVNNCNTNVLSQGSICKRQN